MPHKSREITEILASRDYRLSLRLVADRFGAEPRDGGCLKATGANFPVAVAFFF